MKGRYRGTVKKRKKKAIYVRGRNSIRKFAEEGRRPMKGFGKEEKTGVFRGV